MQKLFFFFLFILFTGFSTLHATIKIMPLGDSITEGWDYTYPSPQNMHAYRNYLWYKLQDANYDVDFVGTKHRGSSVSPAFDGHNEGYAGYTTYQIRDLVYSKLQSTSPDIILLHIGTNDSMYHSGSMAVFHIGEILDKIDLYEKNYNKNITVIIARIIPLYKAGSWVTYFNNALDTMVTNRISAGDDIIKVNMNIISSFIFDNIHPNNTGYDQMANIWFPAVKTAIEKRTDYSYLIPVYGLLLQ